MVGQWTLGICGAKLWHRWWVKVVMWGVMDADDEGCG
jgi:hypothetical protein